MLAAAPPSAPATPRGERAVLAEVYGLLRAIARAKTGARLEEVASASQAEATKEAQHHATVQPSTT